MLLRDTPTNEHRYNRLWDVILCTIMSRSLPGPSSACRIRRRTKYLTKTTRCWVVLVRYFMLFLLIFSRIFWRKICYGNTFTVLLFDGYNLRIFVWAPCMQLCLQTALKCCACLPDFTCIDPVVNLSNRKPVPLAARSKAWVCGRSLDGIAGSNPAGGMSVCSECCVLCR